MEDREGTAGVSDGSVESAASASHGKEPDPPGISGGYGIVSGT
jgi:hypothetical protein